MSKALGTSPETEHRLGLHKVAQVRKIIKHEVGSLRLLVLQRMKGQTGLFFTSYAPDETEAWFEDFKAPDYARAGNIADRDVVLPVGEHDE